MIQYVSTRGGISPVRFDQAVLQGFAADGGLFVPDTLPRFSRETIEAWRGLSYPDLAVEILTSFIDPDLIPENDLRQLISDSFAGFSHPDILPLTQLDTNLSVLELFHGPTLSFKDIAMGFLVRAMDYLLERQGRRLSLVLATTGDTGPAAAHAAAGRATIDCWPLFPLGMISAEQQRQMTTLDAANIHPVGVKNCPDGGDDLDVVVADLFSDDRLKRELRLSSVNSINWCRVMVQAVHYVYAYLRVTDTVGDPVVFSVPSGAFGNLFAGFLAREMGLPVHTFVCANNRNRTLHTLFSKGIFKKRDLIPTVSSAIDIVVPYNFWRCLYFTCGRDAGKLAAWMDRFRDTGEIRLDDDTRSAVQKGFTSRSISDEETLATIRDIYETRNYLLDPHGAVAVSAARQLKDTVPENSRIICLATAHPAKFPDVIRRALGASALPDAAGHPDLDRAATLPERLTACNLPDLSSTLTTAIRQTV